MCGYPGCEKTFGLEKDLDRHQSTSQAHREQNRETADSGDGAQMPEGDRLICRDKNCKSHGKEYSRPDNYGRHVKNMHGGSDSD